MEARARRAEGAVSSPRARRQAIEAAMEHARRDLAVTMLEGWADSPVLTDDERDDLASVVRGDARASRAVFFPLVDVAEDARSRVLRVVVREARAGEDSLTADALPDGIAGAERDAMVEALDAAWRTLGGIGDRPRLRVSFPLFEHVVEERRDVRGASFYLATWLAAVGTLSGREPVRNVVVTGRPGETLRALPSKARALRAVAAGLGVTELMAVSRNRAPAIEPHEGLRVRWCEDLDELLALTFRVPPILRRSSTRCVHVYSEAFRSDVPARFLNRDVVRVDLPRLTADNFSAEVARAVEAIPKYEPVELSIAGPVVLGAALGWALANRPTHDVWIIHAPDGRPWWHSKTRVAAASTPAHGDASSPRALVTRYPWRAKPGWRVIEVSDEVTAEQVHDEVARVAAALAPVGELELAFDTPLALAWAIAATIRNQHARIGFWHYDGSEYARWHVVAK